MSKVLRFGRWPLLVGAVLVPVVALAGAGAQALRGFGPPQSEEQLLERMERAAGRVFDATDATPEQREAVEGILDEAASSLWDRHVDRVARRAEVREVLTADEIDRKALERIRKDAVAAIDEVSTDIVGWVADAAEVFTPDQRRAIADLHDELHRPPVE